MCELSCKIRGGGGGGVGGIVLLLFYLFVCLFVSVLLAELVVLLWFCIFAYRIN